MPTKRAIIKRSGKRLVPILPEHLRQLAIAIWEVCHERMGARLLNYSLQWPENPPYLSELAASNEPKLHASFLVLILEALGELRV